MGVIGGPQDAKKYEIRRGEGSWLVGGDPARGIPTPKRPTVRESHEPGRPLEPGPLAPSQKRCRREGGRGSGQKGVLPRRGLGPCSWCSAAFTGSKTVKIPQAESPPTSQKPLAFSHERRILGLNGSSQCETKSLHWVLFRAPLSQDRQPPLKATHGLD